MELIRLEVALTPNHSDRAQQHCEKRCGVRSKLEHESAKGVATEIMAGKVKCSAEVGRAEEKLLVRSDGWRTDA